MSEFFGMSDYHFNKLGNELHSLEEYVHSLLADRDALVQVLRILNRPIAVAAYPGYEKDVAYSRVIEMREVIEELSQELKDDIA